ncbi:hypothetical protein AVEN_46417-1 [Araneus ventricosus]|uniref:Uncharacterized protein n=1 Tax=Araneus ventricosus TaxID=182803 RepID=A0A4Y2I5W8_ARAVE|nr:hypothetical protein AVEN_46417-1 [Araneus ventricosus]
MLNLAIHSRRNRVDNGQETANVRSPRLDSSSSHLGQDNRFPFLCHFEFSERGNEPPQEVPPTFCGSTILRNSGNIVQYAYHTHRGEFLSVIIL